MQTMDAFSYLSVLFSIIIGLGIAHLLKGAAYFILRRKDITFYTPTLFWCFILFFLHIQIWWASFERRDVTSWNFTQFTLFLMLPTVTYLASFILIPESEDSRNLDLRAVYFRNRRWFYGLISLLPLLSFLQEYLFSGHIDYSMDAALRLVFLLLSSLGWLIASPTFHFWNALLSLLAFLFYVSTLFQKLR